VLHGLFCAAPFPTGIIFFVGYALQKETVVISRNGHFPASMDCLPSASVRPERRADDVGKESGDEDDGDDEVDHGVTSWFCCLS
jgi:hypothetical protein